MLYLKRMLPYKSVPVLMYHQIAMPTVEQEALELAVSAGRFELQMIYLREQGFTSITLSEINKLDLEGGDLRKKLAITFDDGYLDNYDEAFPILKQYDFSATIFLTTDFVGKTHAWGLGQQHRYMDWHHCRELAMEGISFQSHTCSHPDLTMVSDEAIIREVTISRKVIEDILGIPVQHLSYPFGRYDRRVIELTKAAGYESAYASGLSERGRFCGERFRVRSFEGVWAFSLKTNVWSSWIRSLWNVRSLFRYANK